MIKVKHSHQSTIMQYYILFTPRWPQIAISRDRSRGRITSHLDALRSISREDAIWWVLIRSLYCRLLVVQNFCPDNRCSLYKLYRLFRSSSCICTAILDYMFKYWSCLCLSDWHWSTLVVKWYWCWLILGSCTHYQRIRFNSAAVHA